MNALEQLRIKNSRMAAFVEAYATGITGTEAAVRAGYADKDARRRACLLLKRDDVQAALRHINEKIERKAIADAQEVREQLTRIIRQELKEDLLAQKLGKTVEARPRADSVVRAIETLAKLEGWVGPKDADTSQLDAIAEALADD